MRLKLTILCVACLLLTQAATVSSQACQKPPQEPITTNGNAAATTTASCNPKPLIYDNEGCKQCMYLDSHKPLGIKTIAVGLNLQTANAKAILAAVGADYNAIVNGPATPVLKPCDCSKVTCLTKVQIDKILDETVEQATQDAQGVFSTFNSLCCPVQNALVDMSFTLGKTTLATFTEFIQLLTNQNWKASADDLRTTKWCEIQAHNRCNSDADAIQKGCGCTGQFTRNCDAISSACCKQEQTCCKATLTFKNYVTVTKEELLCCPVPDATCCKQNKCCGSQYPVCCPPQFCCAAGNICISGQCYTEDGSHGESVSASCSKRTLA